MTKQMAATAKLFMHGRSQAVRLPKEFRFQGSEVRVSRLGNKIILEPIEKPVFDPGSFWAKLDSYSALDFPDVTDNDLCPELDKDAAFD